MALRVEMKISEMPEMLALLRYELASILRQAALREPDSRVGDRLAEIAAQFEAGAPSES